MSEAKRLEQELREVLEDIRMLDEMAVQKTIARMDILTKPQGSLGRLEELAVQLSGITGDFFPVNTRKRVVVMAADHGITAEGISAFPSAVTAQMVANFAAGGAAINVLARLNNVEVEVVDIGVAVDTGLSAVKKVRIKAGTDNFYRQPAMNRLEVLKAIMAGVVCAREAAASGVKVLATGEMGIGNTTASSAVMAALTGYDPSLVVGRGTGLDDTGLFHKQDVVAKALALHRPDPDDPIGVLELVGGLEIAGLTGLILGAAQCRIPIVVDGFISSTAALAAVKLNPVVWHYLVPSHLSAESGHALLMDYLNLEPYLHMGMRLGEGTGAVIVMQIVEAAARITLEMATFEDAGVSRSDEENCTSSNVTGAE
ncbi:MAG TPA: nicotinate-nucleotide--dimethylbenzimidazole phosphoribosyltransferase [Candidatus Limnocylindrales bacterium]|nr:nicotinate-nucleotide--dimethylbenzimidazole phosphoribosyltransferase [Candidatus Limnocylindrales bacterium]